MADITRGSEVEIVAKALERHYHREGGVCDERDDGPDNCWKSMVGFAKTAIRTIRVESRKRFTQKLNEMRRGGAGLTAHQAEEIMRALWPEV